MFGIHKFVSTVLRNRVILEVLIYMLLRHTCKNESTTQNEQNGKPSPLENRNKTTRIRTDDIQQRGLGQGWPMLSNSMGCHGAASIAHLFVGGQVSICKLM